MALYIVLTVVMIFAIYAMIDNNIIVTTKNKLHFNNLPKEFNGFRIVQLSDLHTKKFGKNNIRLIRRTSVQKPDIIILSGDMVSRDCTNFSNIKFLLTELCKIAPVYYALGNHEIDMPNDKKNELLNIIRNCGCVLLDNSTHRISKKQGHILITGASLKRSIYRNPTSGFSNLDGYTVNELCSAVGLKQNAFNLLIAHNPLFFDTYAEWGGELVLSGHIHGGVIRLPFIGGILSPERKFFPKYSAGVYEKCKSSMYVSRGLGKLRLFNPAEVVVIDLFTP